MVGRSLRPDLFIGAQAICFDNALRELLAGRKESHWMWCVFPQLEGLGQSENSKLFGLSPRAASMYLQHELLATRLVVACHAVLAHDVDVVEMFGELDALKLHSSMTLFEVQGRRIPPGHGQQVIDKVLTERFGGELNDLTYQRLQELAVLR
jgi:uncharacterized protein (DUF1810 family)